MSGLRTVSVAIAALSLIVIALASSGAGARGFTANDLASLNRLSDPVASPDGARIAYVLRETDFEANRGRTSLWIVDAAGARAPARLTDDEGNDSQPQWDHSGENVYFLSTRSGSSQVWRAPAAGGAPAQASDYPLEIENFRLSPAGDRLFFTASVYPDCHDLQCTKERLSGAKEAQESGALYDNLFVRHWDAWKDGRRSALFADRIGAAGAAAGEPVKLTAGLDGDAPPKPFGGRETFAVSPDGAEVFFTLRIAGRNEPLSTDLDIWRVPADGSAPPRLVSEGRDGTDTSPAVSPDGKRLAWLSMRRPGYESDKTDLVLMDLASGETRNVTAAWDRSVSDFAFAPDGAAVYASASDTGTHPIFKVALDTGAVSSVTAGRYAFSPLIAGDRLVYVEQSLAAPADLYAVPLAGGAPVRLTAVNAEKLDGIEFGAYEQFSFKGAGGATVYGYAMKPSGHAEGEKYPVAFIIHGGPQGSFSEGWSYRWNPQTYAGAGYGVVFIDFHGSTGYGQKFTDAINNDWGGKPLKDLQSGLKAAIDRYSWLDGERVCALGASYGGYMVNWIAGNWPGRFNCLVNHAGLFDMRSMYYATEELWFPEWDYGGPYFDREAAYEKWNPARHVKKWRDPMLVIHGAKDYRVPLEQGLATFTALQRRGIDSRLLVFPDENHWILKPANSLQWHETVLDWLDRHLKDAP